MNLNLYSTKDYENKCNWTFGENKPKTKPIQTQTNPIIEKLKLMQSVYLQRIIKKNVDKGYEKQSQSKPNSNLVLSAVEWANFLPPCLECLLL